MKEFWDSRYKDDAFAFGKEPNDYFKQQISELKPGKLLMPAEGEGRNAVYAATLGWDVSAFDMSSEGKIKAEALADDLGVHIDYKVGELSQINYLESEFDAIGLVYVHFPSNLRTKYHQQLTQFLKPGGILILEGFNKKHLQFNSVNPKAGGPKNIDMLFSSEELKSDFSNCDIIELEEKEVELKEGLYHVGQSAVIRFVGRKK